ncbi:MAG: hypothetical protein K6G48_04465 [Acholeplasmatales bacterium]|nr:hypothetical protein [Acholeplasmatales bacterium]
MAENYLTLVKTFVRKNSLHNILSIHTMALNENRINFFVETIEEPKVEAVRAALTKDISFSVTTDDNGHYLGVFVLPNTMDNIEIVEKALLVY